MRSPIEDAASEFAVQWFDGHDGQRNHLLATVRLAVAAGALLSELGYKLDWPGPSSPALVEHLAEQCDHLTRAARRKGGSDPQPLARFALVELVHAVAAVDRVDAVSEPWEFARLNFLLGEASRRAALLTGDFPQHYASVAQRLGAFVQGRRRGSRATAVARTVWHAPVLAHLATTLDPGSNAAVARNIEREFHGKLDLPDRTQLERTVARWRRDGKMTFAS